MGPADGRGPDDTSTARGCCAGPRLALLSQHSNITTCTVCTPRTGSLFCSCTGARCSSAGHALPLLLTVIPRCCAALCPRKPDAPPYQGDLVCAHGGYVLPLDDCAPMLPWRPALVPLPIWLAQRTGILLSPEKHRIHHQVFAVAEGALHLTSFAGERGFVELLQWLGGAGVGFDHRWLHYSDPRVFFLLFGLTNNLPLLFLLAQAIWRQRLCCNSSNAIATPSVQGRRRRPATPPCRRCSRRRHHHRPPTCPSPSRLAQAGRPQRSCELCGDRSVLPATLIRMARKPSWPSRHRCSAIASFFERSWPI